MEKTAPQLIKQWLDSEGRKAKWLAAQVSVDRSTFSVWMHGRQTPNRVHRQELERVTGLPISSEEAWL
jgi:ribosome-binding protein aMBF1 (putative translation factor)